MHVLDSLRLWRDANEQRDDWVRQAYSEGESVATIMDASGLSRAMVYRILERH